MLTGTKIAIGLGALFLLSRQQSNGQTISPQSLLQNILGQIPKASQSTSSGQKGTGGGSGASAGRGGSPKVGGGSNPGGSIEDAFGTFTNLEQPSLIASMFPPDTEPQVAPDFSLFDPGSETQITSGDITDLAAVGTNSGAPQFGGDPSLAVDSSGLLVDPSTGLPFGQAPADSTGNSTDPTTLDSPDFSFEDDTGDF